MFYFANLLILILYSILIYTFGGNNKRKILALFCVLHFSLLAGFRSMNVGTDTQLYKNIFLSTANTSFTNIIVTSKFVGYSLLMKVTALFANNSYMFFLLVVSFLTNGFVFYVAYKTKEASLFLIAYFYMTFYYYCQSLNIARQYLAMAICVCFFYLITHEKKFFRGLLLLFLAISVHSTAIVCLIFIPLSKINWSTKKYIVLFLFSFVGVFLYDRVLSLFVSIFDDYQMYTNNQYAAQGNRVLLVLFLFFLVLFGLIITIRNREKFPNYVFTLQSILIISVVLGLFYSNDQLAVRIQTYFEIFSILYIPTLFLTSYKNNLLTSKVRPFSLLIILVAMIVLIPFYYQLRSNYGNVIPYNSIFH